MTQSDPYFVKSSWRPRADDFRRWTFVQHPWSVRRDDLLHLQFVGSHMSTPATSQVVHALRGLKLKCNTLPPSHFQGPQIRN